MCVGNDDDVRASRWRRRRAAGDEGGTVLVDHTTARRRWRARSRGGNGRGRGFPRRPGLRRQAGAENGKLTIMVGGDAAGFARAEGVLAHYARR